MLSQFSTIRLSVNFNLSNRATVWIASNNINRIQIWDSAYWSIGMTIFLGTVQFPVWVRIWVRRVWPKNLFCHMDHEVSLVFVGLCEINMIPFTGFLKMRDIGQIILAGNRDHRSPIQLSHPVLQTFPITSWFLLQKLCQQITDASPSIRSKKTALCGWRE